MKTIFILLCESTRIPMLNKNLYGDAINRVSTGINNFFRVPISLHGPMGRSGF